MAYPDIMMEDVDMDCMEDKDDPTISTQSLGSSDRVAHSPASYAALKASINTIPEGKLRASISQLADSNPAAFRAFLDVLIEQKKRRADDSEDEGPESEVCINCGLSRGEWIRCCSFHRGLYRSCDLDWARLTSGRREIHVVQPPDSPEL